MLLWINYQPKIALEEKIKAIKGKGNNWLEPMRDFILSSKLAKKVADEGDLVKIRTFLKNTCGELAEPSARTLL